MTQSAPSLPGTIGMWTRPASPQVVTEKNIFDYMDGAGELYLGYRFDHLEVYPYKAPTQPEILVELYFMKSSDDAFGLLSMDWGGEPVDLNPSSQNGIPLLEKDPDEPGWPGALYGEGLLRLWSDDIYARVLATLETPESKQAVLSLGRSIVKGRAGSVPPLLLTEVPTFFPPSWTILEERAAFFRSHLVLNSLYYLSHENILDLGLDCEAVMVPYKRYDSSGAQKRFQLILVKYLDRKHAKNALIRFHRSYFPDHPSAKLPGPSDEMMNVLSVEDGWLAYKMKDKSIVFFFECPDRETAEALIDQIK